MFSSFIIFQSSNTWTITHFEIFSVHFTAKMNKKIIKMVIHKPIVFLQFTICWKKLLFCCFRPMNPFNEFIRAQSLNFLWWCNQYSHLQWLIITGICYTHWLEDHIRRNRIRHHSWKIKVLIVTNLSAISRCSINTQMNDENHN